MYKLPGTLRSRLREPLGKIVTAAELENELDPNTECIVVGDESAITLYKKNYKIKLAIVDFQTRRSKNQSLRHVVSKIGEKVYRVSNPDGTITDELWETIKKALNETVSVRIEVSGEEDLAFLPCMMLAPENSIVIYGYPGRGLVLAWVKPENRQAVQDALDHMIKEV